MLNCVVHTALASRVSSACTFGSNSTSPRTLHGTWPPFSPRCKFTAVSVPLPRSRRRAKTETHLRVIELNVGTICASLPFLPAFYQHHRLKPSQVAALKTITNRIKPFRFGRKMSGDRLETGILGSVQGEGKFLKSGDLTDITASTDTTTQLTEK